MVQMLDGVTIDGKFRLIEAVGKGGTSVVYRGQQLSLNNREVAVKVMSFDPEENPEYALRFKREASIVATLEHPYILPIFEYGSDDDRRLLYLVTPLMQNGSLKQRILKQGAFSLAATIDVLEKIGSALHYAHEQGVIHRDINPRNILLNNFGDPILSDFGLARVDGGMQITQLGYMAGTKAYMGPEQWVGEDVDRRCDIYSLGISLYEMLTGEQPFTGDTPRELAIQHLSEPPPSLLQKAPHLPAGIEHVFLKAVAKRADDRYDTVREFVTVFKAAARQTPLMLNTTPPLERTASAQTTAIMPAAEAFTEGEEGTTFVPPTERTARVDSIMLAFDVPRSEFDSGWTLNTIGRALTPRFSDLAIEVVRIQPGSTIITIAMLTEACRALFAMLQENPELFTPYRLISATYQGRTWQAAGPFGAARLWHRLRPVAVAALAILVMATGALALGSGLGSSPTPTPPPEASALPQAALPASTATQETRLVQETPATIVTLALTATPEPPAAQEPPATLPPSATQPPSPTPQPTVPQPTATQPTATVTPTRQTPTLTATPRPVVVPALLANFSQLSQGSARLAQFVNAVPTPTPLHMAYPTRVLVFPATPVPIRTPHGPWPTMTPFFSVPGITGGSGGSGGSGNNPGQPASPSITPAAPPATDAPPPTEAPPPTAVLPPTDAPKRECGNGICEPGENRNKCPEDCPA